MNLHIKISQLSAITKQVISVQAEPLNTSGHI